MIAVDAVCESDVVVDEEREKERLTGRTDVSVLTAVRLC